MANVRSLCVIFRVRDNYGMFRMSLSIPTKTSSLRGGVLKSVIDISTSGKVVEVGTARTLRVSVCGVCKRVIRGTFMAGKVSAFDRSRKVCVLGFIARGNRSVAAGMVMGWVLLSV